MKEILNPDLYHGNRKNKNYFEGWYYKIVDRYNKHKISIIPGISYGDNLNDHHSFVQIINGHDVNYSYLQFDVDNFKYNKDKFRISINSNIFTLDNISLNLKSDNNKISGNLIFKNTVQWPSSIMNPGSMGFYNYLTSLEYYSQVCILNGSILGDLCINGENINFTGGKIYIEKNWGKSFPKSWLWIQSNSFKNKKASVTCSLGETTISGRSFERFIIGVTLEDKFLKFTTSNRSKLTLKNLGDDLCLTVQRKNLKLTLKTHSNPDTFVACKVPNNGLMSNLVKETLDSRVYMLLEDLNTNSKIFEDTGLSTGIEYGGNLLSNINPTL